MSTSQSLDRGLDILELLDSSLRPLGVREISRQLELSPPIVQRLINTMAQRKYVRQDPDSRRYMIGYKVLSLGASLQKKDILLLEARKEMTRLTETLPVDSYLGVLQDDHAIYLLCVQSEGPVLVRSEAGQILPLHSTAVGKVLLAAHDDAAVLALLGPGPLPAITPATITDPKALVATLDKVRRTGVATVKNENITGIVSVGSPIRDSQGEVCAAISVSYSPHFSPDVKLDDVAAAVKAAAAAITANIGHGI